MGEVGALGLAVGLVCLLLGISKGADWLRGTGGCAGEVAARDR
ncbi:hypothetical protein [Kineosporia rhizophila]|nr:hypothetical protein [Kineosporia rhizophila]